jgi:probable HAF family extracellular repeat protein
MPRHLLLILLAVSCLCKSLSTAHAASYTFTTLDVPGSITTVADGINTAGQIVGFFNDATGGTHGFLTTDGATSTQAFGIGASGQIVGQFLDARTDQADIIHG